MVSWDFQNLPANIQSQSANELLRVLRKAACPISVVPPLHLKPDCEGQVAAYAAKDKTKADLVEYRWTDGERQLAAVVGINGVQVQFDLQLIPECRVKRTGACVAAARAWVEKVLRLNGKDEYYQDFQIELPWPDELTDGVWFSSAPDLEITKVFRWHFRVDAEVHDGILTFYIYKRVAQLMSFQDGSKWFDGQFRAAVLSKSDARKSKQ